MPTIDSNWNILGHDWAVDLLQGHIVNNRIRHAYLFTGPQGVGRRTLAIRLAQALNCTQSNEPGIPCGECRACTLIDKMQHPDLAVVQAEEGSAALKVDQIRELQRTLALAPYEASYKTALLLRFEEANPSAANALLKTLEEPPPQVIMLVTASDAESLLPTIVSRCEVIRLRPLTLDLVVDGLQSRWGLSAEKAKLFAHISGGRPGFAIRLNQNPDLLDQRQSQLDDLLRIMESSRVERFAYVNEISRDRVNLQNTLKTWSSLWRDVMLKTAGVSSPLTNIDRESEITTLANQLDLTTTNNIINHLDTAIVQIERYVNARLVVEVFMMELPQIT